MRRTGIDQGPGRAAGGRFGLGLLAAGTAVYLILGLIPFHFDFSRPDTLAWGFGSAPDTLRNFVFFVPLGWLLARRLTRVGAVPVSAGPATLLATLLLGSLSVAVELLQTGIPMRYPSVSDIAANASGAAVGAALSRRPALRRDPSRPV